MAEGNCIPSLSPKDLVLQLMNLRQSSSVQAYIDRFDETLTQVNLHVDLPEAFSKSCFRGGLRPDIADRVRRLHPTTLQQAFSDAMFIEAVINLEQIVSQPPLHFHTHRAASTVDTKLEQNKGDETLELAIEINEATVATVDIVDDVVFTDEATPEKLDGVESDEAGSDDDELKSTINMGHTAEAKLEQTIDVENDGNHEVVAPTNQFWLISPHFFDPFLASDLCRLKIGVPQFGFRRVYCPVAAHLIHLFRKFGEFHDAFRVFVIMPHIICVSCIISMLDVALFCLWHCCIGWKYKHMSWSYTVVDKEEEREQPITNLRKHALVVRVAVLFQASILMVDSAPGTPKRLLAIVTILFKILLGLLLLGYY